MAYPSTFLDIQNAVLAKGRLDPAEDLSKVKDWINQAYSNAVLESEALIGVATMTPAANCTSQTLGAAALRIKGLFATYGGVQYKPLSPVSLQRMLEFRQGSPGNYETPMYYTLLGLTEIEFYPTPRGTEVFTIYYVKAPTVLSGDTDLPEIPEPYASKVLEYGALAEAADFKRDDMLQDYQQRYLEWIGKLRAHVTRKHGGVPEQMMVLGERPFAPHDPSADYRW